MFKSFDALTVYLLAEPFPTISEAAKRSYVCSSGLFFCLERSALRKEVVSLNKEWDAVLAESEQPSSMGQFTVGLEAVAKTLRAPVLTSESTPRSKLTERYFYSFRAK